MFEKERKEIVEETSSEIQARSADMSEDLLKRMFGPTLTLKSLTDKQSVLEELA